jgi:Arc/MetJ family transcription regulator
MRTNIDLDDDLLQAAMEYSVARSKRGVVHEALQTYVAVKQEAARRESYEQRYQELVTRLAGRTFNRTAAEIVREDREQR